MSDEEELLDESRRLSLFSSKGSVNVVLSSCVFCGFISGSVSESSISSGVFDSTTRLPLSGHIAKEETFIFGTDPEKDTYALIPDTESLPPLACRGLQAIPWIL